MRRAGWVVATTVLVLVAWTAAPRLGLARFVPGPRRDPPASRPTEVVEGDEKAQKKARKAWMAGRHRAAPGVDWRALERTNGLASTARRARPSVAPPPTDAVDAPERWRERGSVNQAGRTHVARWSVDRSQLYVGSAMGGLWSRDAAGAWTPRSDGLYGGVHWLEVLPPEAEGGPDVLVAGTDGGLLHRSVDGGSSWIAAEGVDWSWAQRRLLVTSDGSRTLFTVRGNSDGYRLDRSTDHGATWDRVFDLGDFGGDVWVSRTGAPAVWLASEGALSRSDDLGASWVTVGTLPSGDGVQLAGSEAWSGAGGAPRFWVVVDGAELWRSDDGGASFADIGRVEDYWGSLTASTIDPDLLVYGGVELHKSADGGATFAVQNPWSAYYEDIEHKLHADIQGVDVLPDGGEGEDWFLSTDGGTYRSEDQLQTTTNVSMSGLRVSQYYSTLTSSDDPEHLAAGAQDQGYQVNTGQGGEGDLYNFDQVISGDYGSLVSGDGTHDLVYSVYPGWILIQIGEARPQLSWTDVPADARHYGWLPSLVADPDDHEVFYFLGDRLWRYDREDHWTWVPSLQSEASFSEADGEYLGGMAFSPVDSARVYAVTTAGRMYRSDDHGETWLLTARNLPGGQYFSGTAIVASALDVDTVYVGGSGYSNPAVYRSTDAGDHFDALGEGIPPTLVYSLAEEPESGALYAGTETSALRLAPGAETWTDLTGTGAPVTIYWSAEAVPATHTVRFGTYGRGVWDYEYDPFVAEEPPDEQEEPPAPGPRPAPDCGCASSGPTPGAWTLVALGGWLRRRAGAGRRTAAGPSSGPPRSESEGGVSSGEMARLPTHSPLEAVMPAAEGSRREQRGAQREPVIRRDIASPTGSAARGC